MIAQPSHPALPEPHTQGMSGVARTRDGREVFYQELPGPAGSAAPVVVFESGMAASR
jgi:hypothetical protein